MKNTTLIGLLSIGMVGCSSIPMNAQSEYEEYSLPDLDTVVEVHVGESMIDQGKATTSNVLTVNNHIQGTCFDILKGDYLERGSDSKGKQFFHSEGVNGARVIKAALCDPAIALSINSSDKVCVSTPFVTEASCYQGDATISKKTMTGNSSFRQLLVYSGSVGDKINISYRELSNDVARGAFTNNVEYDMTKSNIIKYKGAEIEVLEYDNMSIKYVVKQHIRPDITY
ncbi:hypothetical protein [Vibrio agarivorans]|uniref:hypothetical protein n=1 Tax=Vibrio agarivorans TaxID=153622 RepID=UPI0025B4DF35|nr:hypothetical protein [Vibrio agarivorans]MDN3662399.1 hypothetical protein [Vibrio agarivorans]